VSELDVAVIIVTYKSADLTVDCLRSIDAERGLPGPKIRVVVVDNASGDGPTVARAIEENRWSPWATLVVAEKNGGFAYGNNVGIQRAFADGLPDYVHLLNPDTLVRKGAIAALVSFLESHPEAGIAGGSFENLDGSDWHIAFRFPTLLSELDQGLQVGFVSWLLSRSVLARRMDPVAQPIDWVSGASMMVRRKVLESVGGLDENYFLYFEETDLCYRAKAAGFSTWYVPESRVMHIAGQSTKVTVRNEAVKRLPPYWFESRRRFFAANYGLGYAMVTDLVALSAHALGHLKRLLLLRADQGVPFYIRDLSRHSVLRGKNRDLPAIKSFKPLAGS
jgi:GT2 family glycosyltransferase